MPRPRADRVALVTSALDMPRKTIAVVDVSDQELARVGVQLAPVIPTWDEAGPIAGARAWLPDGSVVDLVRHLGHPEYGLEVRGEVDVDPGATSTGLLRVLGLPPQRRCWVRPSNSAAGSRATGPSDRYELMLVIRPDLPEDRIQAILDKSKGCITGARGQIVKVSHWGRRRLAYPVGTYREGRYEIVLFDAPSEAVREMERYLATTEEVLRHLVTPIHRPAASRRSASTDDPDTASLPEDEPVPDRSSTDGSGSDEAEFDRAYDHLVR